MNEDIKNAISNEDPELHDRIIRALYSVGKTARVCTMYEMGEIGAKVAMDCIVGIIVEIELNSEKTEE